MTVRVCHIYNRSPTLSSKEVDYISGQADYVVSKVRIQITTVYHITDALVCGHKNSLSTVTLVLATSDPWSPSPMSCII